jgi:hypothetical protein
VAKVLISMEDALLVALDSRAREGGLTRSGYLARLVRGDLAARRGPGADPAVAAAVAKIRQLFREHPGDGEDVAGTVRRMRDERSAKVAQRPA